MLRSLTLERPLAVLDLETTGTDPKVDRIVEISILRISIHHQRDHRTRRVNPGVPIPAEATAVHGIADADVADQPPFSSLAASVVQFLDGCDLCGFNLKRFDLKLLHAELERTQTPWTLAGRRVIDVCEVFHTREPRDLSAALRFYCGHDHDGAHGAEADVVATAEILEAQLDRYADLPRRVDALDAQFRHPDAIDFGQHFVMIGGRPVFAFGKYRNRPLDEIARERPDYLRWMLGEAFYEDTKDLVRHALGEADRRIAS